MRIKVFDDGKIRSIWDEKSSAVFLRCRQFVDISIVHCWLCVGALAVGQFFLQFQHLL